MWNVAVSVTSIILFSKLCADATATNITRINVVNAASVTLPCQSFDEADLKWTFRSVATGLTEIISADGQLSRDFSEQFVLTPAWSGWQNLTVKRVGRSNEGLYTCLEETGPRRVTAFQMTITANNGNNNNENPSLFVPVSVCVVIGCICLLVVVCNVARCVSNRRIVCCRRNGVTRQTLLGQEEMVPVVSTHCDETDDRKPPSRRRGSRHVRWAPLVNDDWPSKPLIKKSTSPSTKIGDIDSDNSDDDTVTPWTVQAKSPAGLNVERLIQRFGATPVDSLLVERLEQLTHRKAHHLLRRQHFFSHRDLELILHCHELRRPFYLYTGRGPSTANMHIGHLVPFIFTKWLQDTFDVPLVIQLTDDEKFLWKDISLEDTRRLTEENVKDIIAVGFDITKTFIFANTDFVSDNYYRNVCKIWKSLSLHRVKRIFGMSDASTAGKIAFPAIQAAPSFSSSFPLIFGDKSDVPCLIPCAMDQDPFFRMTRDVAPKLGFRKPALLLSNFVPALQGAQHKMSASVPASCIYLSDSASEIRNKVMSQVFSGGRPTVAEHRQYGGDCDIDVSLKILSFFMEDDDQLEELTRNYASGKLLTGELKEELIRVVQTVVHSHQENRNRVTDEIMQEFMSPRKLVFDFP